MNTEMKVSDAIMSRISVRDFIPDKVPPLSVILEILNKSREGIGIEDFKWKVYVLHGSTLSKFVAEIQNKLNKGQLPTEQEYNVYPPKLKLEYHKRRKQLAKDMYKLLDIPYKDKFKRFQHLKKNWSFFDAPIGLLFTMDNAPDDLVQFCHLGMYLQNVMLRLKHHGIDSCAQEAWANYSKTIHELLNIDKKELLFCGMSVGYRNPNAKVNTLRSERMELDEFVKYMPSKL
eukprot:1062243_1